MEIINEVKIFEVNYKCDECGNMHMKSDGVCITTYPPKFKHICSSCGYSVILDRTYPYNIYKINNSSE